MMPKTTLSLNFPCNKPNKLKPTVLVKPTAVCAHSTSEILVLDWNGAICTLGELPACDASPRPSHFSTSFLSNHPLDAGSAGEGEFG